MAVSDLRVSFPKPCDAPWEAMTPAGCDRVCDRCTQTIPDLRHYTLGQVDALVRRDPHTCVRAHVTADGNVVLKHGGTRRMIAAIGTAVALLAATAPAVAEDKLPPGAIEGKIAYVFGSIRVLAQGADGTVYHGKVRKNGQYRIKHLPAGTYTLTFYPDCGDPWSLKEKVAVTDAPVALPVSPAQGGCIIVGKLQLDDVEA